MRLWQVSANESGVASCLLLPAAKLQRENIFYTTIFGTFGKRCFVSQPQKQADLRADIGAIGAAQRPDQRPMQATFPYLFTEGT